MDNGAAFSKQAHSVQPYNFARICLSQDYDGKLAMKRLKKAIWRIYGDLPRTLHKYKQAYVYPDFFFRSINGSTLYYSRSPLKGCWP